ncbi:MAG TPA: hypothetical protein VJR94_00010 [Candidatus Nitrosocosmicus sp.]|nr:hypothetical protein [Candidatus Nitrosocosmicus sp.]
MTLQLDQSLDLKMENSLTQNHVKNSTFKYILRCSACSWNISFYEASGSLYLQSQKMVCPFCKEKEIRGIKSPL